jgi:hypothetical protein
VIADEVARVLPDLRAAAESLMTDECTISRAGVGAPVLDVDTGVLVDPTAVVVYEGPCRVQVASSLDVRAVDFGGQAVNLNRVQVSIPVADDEVRAQDVVVITDAANDPQLVGRRFTVRGAEAKSHATVRRLECELLS